MDKDKLWWLQVLTNREAEEVRFAVDYVAQHNHGTPGHMSLTVIAKLAAIVTGAIQLLDDELEEYDMDLCVNPGHVESWLNAMSVAPRVQQ